MDKENDQAALVAAGWDFLRALQELGLDPEGCFWARDITNGRFVLMLMTSAFDLVGPLAISEKIIQAYNASALPQLISPFMVELHSPKHRFMVNLLNTKFSTTLRTDTPNPDMFVLRFEGTPYESLPRWIYKFEEPKRTQSTEILRRWRRFERNVDLLAA